MSSSNFTVGGGLASSRQTLFEQDRSHAIRKIAKEDFRGATPSGLVSLILAAPSGKSELHIDLKDGMVRRIFDDIRDRCQVWIDCFGDEGYIVISARKLQNVQNGLQEVRDWVLVQSKELEGNATTLVYRVGDKPRSCILLKPTQDLGLGTGITDGWRGVAQISGVEDEEASSSTTSQSSDTAQQNGQNSNDLVITKQLLDAIKQAAELMRPDLGRKYVRIHLGLRSLSKRKIKDEAHDQYTTPQFRTLMNSATKRGYVSFRLCFGGKDLTKAILQHAHETDNPEDPAIRRFVAPDATIDHLRDVKPRFCLVFFSKNLRIEMDIHVELAKVTSGTNTRVANRRNLPTASSPRVFRFNKTVDAEIAVACPDFMVDWQLSVDSDLSADQGHDHFHILAKELRFDPVPENGVTFPVVHASSASLRKANIDSVAFKAIWTFDCVKTPCRVDLTEYYDWDAHPLSEFMGKNPHVREYEFSISGRNCPIPNKSCAVAIYGEDWDEKMRNINPASGRFAEEFINLFGCGLSGEQYVGSLLQEVEFLQDITTQAAAEAEDLLAVPTQATTDAEPVTNTAARAETETKAATRHDVAVQMADEAESLLDFTD